MNALAGILSVLFAVSLALGGPPRFLPPWTALLLLAAAMTAKTVLDARRAGKAPDEASPRALLFWGSLALYLGSLRWHGGDDIPNSMLPFVILRHGTLAFDPIREWATNAAFKDLIIPANGRLLSFYPVAPGVLALPLYVIPALAGIVPSDQFLHNLAKIAGAAITAGSAVVLFMALERRHPRRLAFDCAALYALGTFAFSVSSQGLYSHGPAQLGVALALLGILSKGPRWAAAAGVGLGLAAISREDSAFFGLAGAAYFLFHDRRRFFPYAVGAALPLALNFAYWKFYGGSFRPPYHEIQAEMFVALDPAALWGMLASPSRGLFPYMPAAAFGVWGAWKASREPGSRWAPYFAAACAATWIFYGFRRSWTGGVSFGNRYFSVVALVFAYLAAEALAAEKSPKIRRAWGWCAAVSIVIHAVGAYLTWPGVAMTLQEQAATLWELRMHPLAYLFTREGPLGGIAQPGRAAAAAALIALSWPLARLLEKRARA